MKLIVGLGNPGPQYAATRHNVGFMVVDRLMARHAVTGEKTKFHAQCVEANLKGERVLLLKPVTFMNRSGLAVGEAANFYKLPPMDVMVVVDDTALPVGALRLRAGGSAGGHNGLSDIQRALATSQYPRLRLGVGAPMIDGHPIPQADYVLGAFDDDQAALLRPALDRAVDAIETWLTEGLDIAMTRHNTPRNLEEKPVESDRRPPRRRDDSPN
jgi:PTH1 family peptidyl-tRNA hydrolase